MSDKDFMRQALELARLEAHSGKDIPVGCVIVHEGKIIASASNKREAHNDISAHAEILAIKKAEKVFNNWRLNGCSMYVTLEPCPMCAWAVLNSRIDSVYFGSYDLKYGALGSKVNLVDLSDTKVKVYGGILEDECDKILKNYFSKLRDDKADEKISG